MGSHCASSTFVGTGIVPALPLARRQMTRQPAWAAPTASTDEDEGMIFAGAPVSEIELPADGGAGEAGAPRLTVLSSVETDVVIEEMPGVTRAERARQVIRSMLRSQERAAS